MKKLWAIIWLILTGEMEPELEEVKIECRKY
jgi:hypothetical protein